MDEGYVDFIFVNKEDRIFLAKIKDSSSFQKWVQYDLTVGIIIWSNFRPIY